MAKRSKTVAKPLVSPIDARELRQAMGRFATGVTVVTTVTTAGKREGVTANSFSTVSLDPPLILWSLGKRAGSFASFTDATHFAVNVLAATQVPLCQHFSRSNVDKLAGIAHTAGEGGCALLTGALAHFECALENTIDGGDHTIFLGRVLRARHRDGEPLIFSAGSYCRPAALSEGV